MRRGSITRDRGAVLVETAVAIPVLVVLTVLAVWAVSLGATYVRALDAAQTAARQVARGQQPDVMPAGMALEVSSAGDLVTAVVRVDAVPPVPSLVDMAVTVQAQATAAFETPSVATP